MEYTEEQVIRWKNKAEEFEKFRKALDESIGYYDEETDEFIEAEGQDLCTTGEFVFDYFDLWL